MAKVCTGDKKLLPFYILEILREYSDADNHLTQAAIIDYLDKNYNIVVDRKAVSSNIARLTDGLGYDIENEHGKGYYLVSREFEDSELRLLIDCVRFSKYIKKSHSDDIVDRLLKMGTPKFRKSMSAVKYVSADSIVKEQQLFLCIEEIVGAISKTKKVAFQYLEYDVNKTLTPVWDGRIIVSPQELVAANGYYYLIGLIENNDGYTNFRLDKIRDVTVLDDNVDTKLKFNLKEYLSTHPLMYCGEPISATLKADIKIMGDIIDFFGDKFTISKNDCEYVEIVVRANEWDIIDFAMRNAYFVEVLAPNAVRQKIKHNVESLVEKYKRPTLSDGVI